MVIGLYSFGQSQSKPVDTLMWLIGEWEFTEKESTIFEEWKVENDSTLVGKSRTMKNGKRTFDETLRIEFRDSTYRYIAFLPQKTAVFKLEQLSESSISFADPKNDFPSSLVYNRSKSGIQIILSGSGRTVKMDFEPK